MLTALTTQQIVLLAIAAVVAVVWGAKNWRSILDSITAAFGYIKDGDIKGAIISTLQNSDVFVKYNELSGEAKNVIAYAKTKHDSDNVPEIVDTADQEAVKAAYATILGAIAKATTDVQPTVASRK